MKMKRRAKRAQGAPLMSHHSASASSYQESGIFKKALYGRIAGIIGVAIAIAVILRDSL